MNCRHCPTSLPPVQVITPTPFTDERGFFARVFDHKELGVEIAQINHSMTKVKGSIRGMHFQRAPFAEVKIVKCLKGSIFDVTVDLRKDSPTYLRWHGEVLSAENLKMLVVPQGFAHGFQSLEDDVEIIYFCSAPYNPESEGAVRYNDPKIGIEWPLPVTVVSAKDKEHPLL
jgi:dTDP-4-dehydrorhamnose 3,5-epimerase